MRLTTWPTWLLLAALALIVFLIAWLTTFSAVAQPMPPMPPMPAPVRIAQSPKGASLAGIKPMSQPSPPLHLHLAWNMSNRPAGIAFEVWQTTNLTTPFALAATTADTNWPLLATNAQCFYTVRAILTNTGEVSGWSTKE